MINARETLNEFMNGVGKLSETNGEFIGKFLAVDGGAGLAVDAKTRELVALGVGINKICKYCICVHTYGAYKAGATRAEILAAAEVAVAMGGGPAIAYSATVLNAALDEFEHDFD